MSPIGCLTLQVSPALWQHCRQSSHRRAGKPVLTQQKCSSCRPASVTARQSCLQHKPSLLSFRCHDALVRGSQYSDKHTAHTQALSNSEHVPCESKCLTVNAVNAQESLQFQPVIGVSTSNSGSIGVRVTEIAGKCNSGTAWLLY